MATNNFKAFALDPNANVLSQADWEALPTLLSGFTSGKASSAQVNKALRQSLFIASALAEFVSTTLNTDILDDGDINGFMSKLTSALQLNSPGRLINIQTITTSGTYTKTPGAKHALIRAVGGGQVVAGFLPLHQRLSQQQKVGNLALILKRMLI